MTSLKSRASTSSAVGVRILILIAAALLMSSASVDAAPRKRLVVLDFDGPKADKFHADLVKLLKKSATVVPTDKWNTTADDLSATKLTEKNIKKVAKKLKVDGVIEGTIEKRRDQYIVRLKLHEGKTGAVVGKGIDVKAAGPRLDGDAAKDLKDELTDAIDALGANRATEVADDGGDDDAKPAKHRKPDKGDKTDDDEDAKPKHGAFSHRDDDDDAKPAKHRKPGKGDKGDDDATPPPDKHRKPDKVADDRPTHDDGDGDGDGDGDEEEHPKRHKKPKADDDETATPDAPGPAMFDPATLTQGTRAVEAMIGLSLNDRKLKFSSDADLANPPPGYAGVPVAGIDLDITAYPFAFGHKRHSQLANIGLNLLVDRVIKESSTTSFTDAGATKSATLDTEQLRVGFGLVYRYPFNDQASAPVIGGMVRYGRQQFIVSHTVNGATLPTGVPDVPNVHYHMFEIGPFFRLPLGTFALDAKLDFLAVTDSGDIQNDSQYGGGKVTAFEGELGLSYAISKILFLRLSGRYEQFRFTFNGTGDMTHDRSLTPTTPPQNVHSATDTYFGGTFMVGALY